jgi:hypothetical protein
MPQVFTNGEQAVVAYWAPWRASVQRQVAVVRFHVAHEVYLGGPNEEAFSGHPLFEVGLSGTEFAEVKKSPWIAALERRNRVHPDHDRERFVKLRHFILPFHDETFECVAESVVGELVSALDPWVALRDSIGPPA